jgi:hypothetical protein
VEPRCVLRDPRVDRRPVPLEDRRVDLTWPRVTDLSVDVERDGRRLLVGRAAELPDRVGDPLLVDSRDDLAGILRNALSSVL